MFGTSIVLAQMNRPANADWIEPFIIGVVVGIAIMFVFRWLYRRA